MYCPAWVRRHRQEQELLGDRAPGLLVVGFASTEVADTTFAESRGCGVCVNSSDELGIALTALELSAAQSGFFLLPPIG
jgi:hypothetical protein